MHHKKKPENQKPKKQKFKKISDVYGVPGRHFFHTFN